MHSAKMPADNVRGGSQGLESEMPLGAIGHAASNPTECWNINEFVRPKWSHLEYRWRLDNFWELRALACVEALGDDGGLIWSQKFGDKERGFWQLKLYPYGDLSGAGIGHVSLFLSLDLKSLETPRAYAIFGCYLLDESGQKVPDSGRSFTRQKFAEGSSSWGWSQFIKVEGQSLHKLLSNTSNSLIIKCEIEVFVGTVTAPGRSLPLPKSWEDEMKAFLSDRRNFDVSLICGDRIIRVNKNILCARSKWFERRLAQSEETAITKSNSNTGPFDSTGDSITVPHPSVPPSSLIYASFEAPDMDMSLNSTADTNAHSWRQTDQSASKIDAIAPSQTGGLTLEVNEVQPVILENIVAFMNTDDCRYFSNDTPLKSLLELLVGSWKLEVEALYNTLVRRLTVCAVSKPAAFAIQTVAESIGATDLADHCSKYLLMCVRELTDDELLKALAPIKR